MIINHDKNKNSDNKNVVSSYDKIVIKDHNPETKELLIEVGTEEKTLVYDDLGGTELPMNERVTIFFSGYKGGNRTGVQFL